jgi:hypothetical protein
MKDMKDMKGGFVVDPDVYRIIQAVHFLTQRRREIWVGVSFFAQW